MDDKNTDSAKGNIEKEDMGENVRRYWLYERQIVVFEPTGITRKTVDSWFNTVMKTAQDWPEGRPFLELHDMRESAFTPYARERTKELTDSLPVKNGRTAIVIPSNFVGRVMQFFVNNILRVTAPKGMERRVFFTFIEAESWLLELAQPE